MKLNEKIDSVEIEYANKWSRALIHQTSFDIIKLFDNNETLDIPTISASLNIPELTIKHKVKLMAKYKFLSFNTLGTNPTFSLNRKYVEDIFAFLAEICKRF